MKTFLLFSILFLTTPRVYSQTDTLFVPDNFRDSIKIRLDGPNSMVLRENAALLILKQGKKAYSFNKTEQNEEVLQLINPESIEQIDVVKGDAAMQAYGDKGKDGVIIISLKKGQRVLLPNHIEKTIIDIKHLPIR